MKVNKFKKGDIVEVVKSSLGTLSIGKQYIVLRAVGKWVYVENDEGTISRREHDTFKLSSKKISQYPGVMFWDKYENQAKEGKLLYDLTGSNEVIGLAYPVRVIYKGAILSAVHCKSIEQWKKDNSVTIPRLLGPTYKLTPNQEAAVANAMTRVAESILRSQRVVFDGAWESEEGKYFKGFRLNRYRKLNKNDDLFLKRIYDTKDNVSTIYETSENGVKVRDDNTNRDWFITYDNLISKFKFAKDDSICGKKVIELK